MCFRDLNYTLLSGSYFPFILPLFLSLLFALFSCYSDLLKNYDDNSNETDKYSNVTFHNGTVNRHHSVQCSPQFRASYAYTSYSLNRRGTFFFMLHRLYFPRPKVMSGLKFVRLTQDFITFPIFRGSVYRSFIMFIPYRLIAREELQAFCLFFTSTVLPSNTVITVALVGLILIHIF